MIIEQGKYDVELTSGDVTVGYVLDRSEKERNIDYAEADTAISSAYATSALAAGDYNWKDQRNMPGISISDFRGGQGQKALDRGDALANAFKDGRHLDCSVEGEVRLAQSFISVESDGLESHIIEADGKIWAAFTPSEDPDSPQSVRWLKRATLHLSAALDLTVDGDGNSILTTTEVPGTIAVGDVLYLPDAREALDVLEVEVDGAGSHTVLVDRAAALFDNGDGLTVAREHEVGARVELYGWRTVEFTPSTHLPPRDQTDWIPTQQVRGFAFDGQSLYVAFSSGQAGSYESSIWRYPDESGKFELFIDDVADVQQISYSLGWLYYATSTVAGYIGRNITNDGWELNQLSMKKVVGYTEDGSDDERYLISPEVDSIGLTANNTWMYWLTQSGRNSWLYRVQAPLGFELVCPFARGFVATSIESAFGDVFVGGYYVRKDAIAPGKDGYEGVLYFIRDSVAERVMTLDTFEVGLDNRIKGITAIGKLLAVSTNTQMWNYSVETGGHWHVGTLPPRDFKTSILTEDLSFWNWDLVFALNRIPTADAAHWTRNGVSTKAPTLTVKKDAESTDYLNASGKNGHFVRYNYEGSMTGLNRLVCIQLAKTTNGAFARRGLEVSLQNGAHEARFRVRGELQGKVWNYAIQTGTWNAKRKRWKFDEFGWMDGRNADRLYFQLTERGAFTWYTSADDDTRLSEHSLAVTALATSTKQAFWWGCGTKIGEAIVYNKKKKKWLDDEDAGINQKLNFHAAVREVRVTDDDLSPQRYVMTPSVGTGAAAELDGELFLPIMKDTDDTAKFVFTRFGETYTGGNAYLTTSDSYQNMGTAQKFYRRFEVSLPELLDGQLFAGLAYVDGQPMMATDVEPDYLVVEGEGIEGANRGSTLLQKVINHSGIKAAVTILMHDDDHLRTPDNRLKVNTLALRFMPASSPMRRAFVFNCITDIECRDGSKWDVDAAYAVNFIKDLKKSGSIVTVTTDEGPFDALVDAFKFVAAEKTDHAKSVKQGQVQIVLKVIDE